MKNAMLFISAMLLIASCDSMPANEGTAISVWQPELNQPIQQLEEHLAKLEKQQPINYTNSNIAFLYDAKLFILFHKFLAKVPPSQREKLIKNQEEWLVDRKKVVSQEYDKYRNEAPKKLIFVVPPLKKVKQNKAGTIAAYTSAEAFIDITKMHIKEINKKLETLQP